MNPAERCLAIGDQFDTMQDLRRACKAYAVQQNFEFKTSHSDKKRYRIHFVHSEQCPWHLHATLIPVERSGDAKMVEIKVLDDEHTCNGLRTLHHRQAGVSLISSAIQGRIQDHPRYRPAEVVRDARREQGIKISYSTAWRAKEDAVAKINGSHEDAYAQLPQYCMDIVTSNPSSTVVIERTDDNRFLRLFICYAASASGFAHGYCLRHLYENMHKKHKNPQLREHLYNAARAVTKDEFDIAIQRMRDVDPGAVEWLELQAPKEHWCEYYFAGNRYGHITSNIAESINAWLLDACEKPILAMLEQIRHQLMDWFTKRRLLDTNVEGILVSSVAAQIKHILTSRARRYRVIPANDVVLSCHYSWLHGAGTLGYSSPTLVILN